MLGIKEIEEIIPHRHPFLLIDCVESLTPGEKAVAYKSVSFTESHFQGHFPAEPIMPGVLIIDKLRLECELIRIKGPLGVGKATATVDGEIAVQAELTFMIGK